MAQRSRAVALVVAEPDRRVFSEPFFAGVVRGMSQQLSARDAQLVLLMIQRPEDEPRVERYLLDGHIDGVGLLSLHANSGLPERLASAGMPVVTGGRPFGRESSIPCVDVDNRVGACEAVRYLLDQGRRQIATITGPLDMTPALDRLAGFRDAHTDVGIEVDDLLVVDGDFSRDAGVAGVARLLATMRDFDAIFAASDLMAAGALQALFAAGRRVPGDVAVIGFDDSEVATSVHPMLTTVHQPVEEMGAAMAQILLAEGAGRNSTRETILSTKLVIRDSA